MSIGLILSGGGARGAYEVGVLSYVFGELVRKTGRVPRMDIISGCSVGAVNGAFMASVAHEPTRGVEKLVDLWFKLDFNQVLSFGLRELAFVHRVWLGGARPQGLFNAEPLTRLIGSHVSWLNLSRNLRRGVLSGLTVATTKVATGQPHVWVDLSPHHPPPPRRGQSNRHAPRCPAPGARAGLGRDPDRVPHGQRGRRAALRRRPAYEHAHRPGHPPRSPAPVRGGPVAPPGRQTAARGAPARARAGAPFLFGKVLDAFFLDHVDADLREIHRVNEYLDMGKSVYGPSFLERMNAEAKNRGKPERSPIKICVVRPSADLGGIAYEFFGDKRRKIRGDTAVATALLRFLDVGEAAEADLASFLLFDEAYVRLLVELGRKDAADKRDQLEDFFFGS